MPQVTNLNRFRKQKAREDARNLADARAAQFGRSKSQKAAEAEALARATRHMDAHRRDDDQTESRPADADLGEDGGRDGGGNG